MLRWIVSDLVRVAGTAAHRGRERGALATLLLCSMVVILAVTLDGRWALHLASVRADLWLENPSWASARCFLQRVSL